MNKIHQQYNQIGGKYIRNKKDSFSNKKDKAIKYIKEQLPSFKDKKILDIGCGTGDDILMYEKMNTKEIWGIDSSSYMINQAKKMVSNPERLLVSSIEKTAFTNNYFDVAVSRYALHYLDKFDNAYKESSRIPKKNGLLIFVVPHPFRDLVIQKDKKYGKKEILKVKLFKKIVEIKYPSHTLQEYFSPTFFQHFQLLDFQEDPQSDEYEKDKMALPGFIGITVRNLT